MTLLMNLSLLLALPATFSPPIADSTSQQPEQERYCNERYLFCSDIPTATLPFQTEFNDGDGIVLQDLDRTATVTIAGYRGFSEETPKEIYSQAVKQIAGEGERAILLNHLFGEDFYECYFLIGRKQYYHQAYLFDGYIVRLSIEVPINQPLLVQSLRSILSVEFQPAAKGDTEKLGSRG